MSMYRILSAVESGDQVEILDGNLDVVKGYMKMWKWASRYELFDSETFPGIIVLEIKDDKIVGIADLTVLQDAFMTANFIFTAVNALDIIITDIKNDEDDLTDEFISRALSKCGMTREILTKVLRSIAKCIVTNNLDHSINRHSNDMALYIYVLVDMMENRQKAFDNAGMYVTFDIWKTKLSKKGNQDVGAFDQIREKMKAKVKDWYPLNFADPFDPNLTNILRRMIDEIDPSIFAPIVRGRQPVQQQATDEQSEEEEPEEESEEEASYNSDVGLGDGI